METLVALSCGLGVNSRIQQKINHLQVPVNTFLLASIVDKLNILIWQKTKDGAKNRNRPKSLVDALSGRTDANEVKGFDTAEDFKAALKRFEVT